jgi:hypothetical protein
MTDIGINGNALFIIALAYGLAWACVGAAFMAGFIERRDRKAKRNTKSQSINFTT